jgi:hypothetical protein
MKWLVPLLVSALGVCWFTWREEWLWVGCDLILLVLFAFAAWVELTTPDR